MTFFTYALAAAPSAMVLAMTFFMIANRGRRNAAEPQLCDVLEMALCLEMIWMLGLSIWGIRP